MGSKLPRFVIAAVLLLVLAPLAWTWLAMHWSYADGERAGYVQKLSRKGWLCKTWEGEMAMVTMPGAIPDKFEFTVRDDAVAAKINQLAGKRVVLMYSQHKLLPTSCTGETEYFVSDIREVEPLPAVAAPGIASEPAATTNAPADAQPAKP
jgi:hypothetical protein